VRHDMASNPAETSSTATPTATSVTGYGWRRVWTPTARKPYST
jgi:hypothetical protein